MRRRVTALLSTAVVAALGTVVVAPAASADTPTELFFSEYIEGSGYNKALEIYNGTGGAVDLAAGGYEIDFYYNGNAESTFGIELAGTVVDGDVFVIAPTNATDTTILDEADQQQGTSWFNGDDAVVLRKGETVLDVIGQIAFDPGAQWGVDLISTADNTLRRAETVCAGDPDGSNVFDPSVEWVGYANNTVDGLGAHTATCAVGPAGPVINEFSASTTGTDVEYVEFFGDPSTDYSAYTLLEIEGDSDAAVGTVDEVILLGTTDANGLYLANLPANALENGTITLLLVQGFTGALGNDLDTNNDGSFDVMPWTAVVDAVAVSDGGASDLTYGVPVLGPNYDELSSFAPGGASRIPDGFDTDSASDWVRNDFDLAGIPGNTGSITVGEAYNTPGALNEVYTPPPFSCETDTVSIGSVQGSGDASPEAGNTVAVEGIVVGDFQVGGFNGYYLQDSGDGDPATSDGIFVFAPGGTAVSEGDEVHVIGEVSEYYGLTELNATTALVCDSGLPLPEATELTLPADASDYEPLEGMRVTLPQSLAILEYYNFGRYGEIRLGTDRQYQPTAVYEPGSPEAIALAEANILNSITLDDGRSWQNPDPAIHPNGAEFTLDNLFRGGDLVTNATGVLDYRFDVWRVQPTQGADFEAVNPRPEVPEVGGTTTVASFNVLNYFTTLGSRGADDEFEFERQEAKIVSAIAALDADIVGLIEIENNNGVALDTLVAAINDFTGEETYAAIDTGKIGSDEITTAFIYQPAEVMPAGDFAILDSTVDPRFLDAYNRPALAQTFVDRGTGGDVTVVVNHLKSKGSDCEDVGDLDMGDGQGNCNVTRTLAAEAMADWLAGSPTGAEPGRALIIGDLNAYDKEDPIQALTDAGYTDLLLDFQGEYEYSYVFDGQLGYLDHALAGVDLLDSVTGAAAWHINADEPSIIDYDMTFKADAQDALYAPDPFRSSDHDPVLIGLDLEPTEFFATGGGWFTSPEGSLVNDPSWSGKATFGLSVKYEPGMPMPTGSLSLNLVRGGFTASATTVDWLLVSGDTARFAGPVMVNGEPGHTFHVTVMDGGKKDDMIAIVITDSGGDVVYDSDGAQSVKGQLTIH